MIRNTINYAIHNIWPMLTIFVVVICVIRFFQLKNNRKEFVFYKEILSLIFIVYLFLLFEMVTNNESWVTKINLVPFSEILRYKFGTTLFMFNVIGNIVVFIPFGYFVSLYVKPKNIWSPLIISAVTSLTIELVQLRIGRAFDVDDIMLNTFGGLLGFLVFVGLSAINKHLPKFMQTTLFLNFLTIILVGLFLLYYFGLYNFGV